jgi:signal transduction histidine kinase
VSVVEVKVPLADGSGLGLSIVRSVTRAHGGEVIATPVPGEGCGFG